MDYNQLGKRIRQQRKLKKWTQEKLAEMAGISVSFLGHIERGTRKASVETLVAIANSLQTGTDFLLSDSLEFTDEYKLNAELNNRQRNVLKGIARVLAEQGDDYYV